MNRSATSSKGISRILFLCLSLALGNPGAAFAHALGENYVWINVRANSIDGHFEIHFDDLDDKVGVRIDAADPSAAVRATAARVQQYILANFSIGPEEGTPYTLDFVSQDMLSLPQGAYARYHFRAATGPLPDVLRIRHTMLYEGDRLHRGLLLIEHNEKTGINYGGEYTAMVFGPTAPDQTLNLLNIPSLLGGRQMVWQGVLHIWGGIDHVLFLLALLLPTVLMLRDAAWRPVVEFKSALWNVLKVVTVFTVAHSVTLLLAALGFLDVPSRFVESVIALSIILVAVNNITGTIREGALLVVLTLGLFHGLGFASVMAHLPFRMESLVKAVVGFNIGVELGQLAIVATLFPLLFLLRKMPLYIPVVLKGGSVVLILISSAWFVQRAFGLD
jgi:hypothetical protein